jgi:hypothetical protein
LISGRNWLLILDMCCPFTCTDTHLDDRRYRCCVFSIIVNWESNVYNFTSGGIGISVVTILLFSLYSVYFSLHLITFIFNIQKMNVTFQCKDGKTVKFNPSLTPRDIFIRGSFGGTYWRPIYSSVTGKSYKNKHKKYTFLRGIPQNLMTAPWD